ncbi:MAG: tetratricopeptide repeat protein [Treponemataceae bacterium]|nr:tetratricopeptide repeat protein [Treponemataceae bacterium]
MTSVIFQKRFFLAATILFFAAAVFPETEEELKKRLLSEADLAGESMNELMAADDENDAKLFGKAQKMLPSTFERDVPYTAEEITFMDLYYNHGISSVAQRRKLHEDAIASAEKFQDEYARLVHLARAEYYYGVACIESFDLSLFEDLKNVESKTGDSAAEVAGAAFDKAIEYGHAALEIKKGSDAYSIISHSISANCTAKNWTYILGNALKVRSYAKKAVSADYSNGTAQFLVVAQDVYAPWPIGKVRSGRKKMISILKDKYVRVEDQDTLLICAAIGYSYFKQKKWNQAIEWYNKALEVYPYNYSAHQMLGTINRRKSKN